MKTKVLYVCMHACKKSGENSSQHPMPASLDNQWRCCMPKQNPKCSQMQIAQTKDTIVSAQFIQQRSYMPNELSAQAI